MPNISDVARVAGVSPGTVSRVLNRRGGVSRATENRVLEAVEALGYRPSPLARSMRTGVTLTIALAVPDITSPFFGELFKGIEGVCLAHGYEVIVCSSDENVQKQLDDLRTLVDRRVDGIILSCVNSSAEIEKVLEEVAQAGVPVVLVDRVLPEFNGNAVVIDNVGGAYEATKYLAANGNRKIAFVGGPSRISLAAERLEGYRRAVGELGLDQDPSLFETGQFTFEGGYEATQRLLKLKHFPDAVFAANDLMAIGVMKALKQNGLRIPDDIEVMGFDGISYGKYTDPPLSTMVQPTRTMGIKATELLARRIRCPDESEPHREVLVVQLVERLSTRKSARTSQNAGAG